MKFPVRLSSSLNRAKLPAAPAAVALFTGTVRTYILVVYPVGGPIDAFPIHSSLPRRPLRPRPALRSPPPAPAANRVTIISHSTIIYTALSLRATNPSIHPSMRRPAHPPSHHVCTMYARHHGCDGAAAAGGASPCRHRHRTPENDDDQTHIASPLLYEWTVTVGGCCAAVEFSFSFVQT